MQFSLDLNHQIEACDYNLESSLIIFFKTLIDFVTLKLYQ